MLRIDDKELREIVADWLVNQLDQSQIGTTTEVALRGMIGFSLDDKGKASVTVEGLSGEL
jgi:hypothetical protein